MSRTFETWRAEIVAELDEARAELAAAVAAFEQAEETAAAARVAHEATEVIVAKIAKHEALAAPLANRWDEAQREFGAVVGQVRNARQLIEMRRRRVAEWAAAIEQVDAAMGRQPTDVGTAAPPPVMMSFSSLARRSGHLSAEGGPAREVGSAPAESPAEAESVS